MQDQISELFFVRGDPEDEPELPECPESCVHRNSGLHFHCKWVSILFSDRLATQNQILRVPRIDQKMGLRKLEQGLFDDFSKFRSIPL